MPSLAGSIHARTGSDFVRIIATLVALILALTVTVLALAATDNNPILASLSIDDVSGVEGNSGGVEAIFTLANASNATIADGQGVGTITSDDSLPSLSIADVSALEGNSSKSNVAFTVALSAASNQQVTVSYASANGTAIWPSDYFRIRQTTLTFAPGTITQTITAQIKGDTLYESDETFLVNLFNVTNAAIADDQAVGTILNDDAPPTVQFSAAAYTVNEGAGLATITATLTGATGVTATVSYATSDGTALAGSDYTATSGTLAFAPGTTARTFSVAIIGDTALEENETLVVTLSNPVSATLGSPNPATLTILDDDGQSTIQFSAAAYSVNESAGSATITATLTGATALTATVSYATSNGTALAGSDYTASSGTLTFAPGVTSLTFSVPIANDMVFEGNESLIVTLSNAVGATLGSPNPATLTIVDNDSPPTVRFSATTYSVNEGAGSATITATLTGATGVTATVSYATSNGTALAGSDYTATSGTLAFAPGTTARTFSVAIIGDTALEENETLVVTLSNPVSATLGSPNPAILTILDDDAQPTIQFSAATYSVNESAGSATITVTLTGSTTTTATVSYATSDGTALAGSDYTASSGTLAFAPGVTSRTFSVPIINDTVFEANESVALTLSNPVSATLGSPNPATLTILDDDGLPAVQFSSATYSVNESAGSAAIVASLSKASAFTVTVSYATSNGTALAGGDYTAASGTLTFAPGTTARTFDVTIIGDALDEVDETITLTLSNPSGNAALGTPNPATLIIVDDDGVPTVRFHTSAYSVNENAGPATIIATLSNESAFTVTIQVATRDSTASSAADYAPVSRALSFAPETTAIAFSVPITDDTFFEGNETLTLTLSNPVSATLGSPNPVALTIVDNEAQPTVQFSAATYSVAENAGSAVITATLSTPSALTATVNIATSDSTASSAADYAAVASRLTLAPGATRVSFTVPITDDIFEEPNETVTLALSVPNNATLGTPHSATLTILDDDHRLYLPLIARAYVARPNLVPISFKVSPATPIVSQTTTFTVVIQNQGTTAITTPFWVDLYIDPVRPPAEANETWDQLCAQPLPDCYGGAWEITRTLAPGQLITLTSAALHPDFDYWPDRFVTSGSHAVYVYADSWEADSSPSGAIIETNESDNRADLIVNVAPALMQNQAEAQAQLTTPLTPDRVLKAIRHHKKRG